MKDVALVVVDMLYDFIDGSMACANAENAVAETVKYIEDKGSAAQDGDDVIVAAFPTMFVCDHHPSDHCSFTAQGGPWPPHCVQGTRGAEIHDDLKPYVEEALTFYKGYRKDSEQYSGFEGINDAGQSLYEVLDIMDIHNVYVCGIATEYCVKNTCMNLLKAGFNVYLLKDAIGYVEHEGHLKALEEMEKAGIRLV